MRIAISPIEYIVGLVHGKKAVLMNPISKPLEEENLVVAV
jgi:hypothetical protein